MDNKKILISPGDVIEIKNKENYEIIIGPGLRKDKQDTIIVTRPGVLRHKENNFFWVDSHQKRYVPAKNDYLIGICVMRSAETFKIDIGSSEYASLSCLAFENATKRNKPNVEISDILYCRVLTSSKDMEPEIVCIDANGKANGLGLLKEGFLFKTSLEVSRRLLAGSNEFLKKLSKICPPYEIAVGINGRIWVKTERSKDTIFIVDAINRYSQIKDADVQDFVDKLSLEI